MIHHLRVLYKGILRVIGTFGILILAHYIMTRVSMLHILNFISENTYKRPFCTIKHFFKKQNEQYEYCNELFSTLMTPCPDCCDCLHIFSWLPKYDIIKWTGTVLKQGVHHCVI